MRGQALFNFIKKENYRRLVENFFSLYLLQGANYLLPLITLPYLTRVLGTDKFGLVMFVQAFTTYFVILSDYGFNLSAAREVSVNRDNPEKISEIISSVLITKTTLLIIGFGLLNLIIFSFARFQSDWLLYYLAYGLVFGQAIFPVWFFQGMERMKYITILNVIAKSIFTASIFIVVNKQADYYLVPFLNSMGYIVAGTISLFIIYRQFNAKFMMPSFKTIYGYFRDSTQFFLSRASVSIYSNSNTFAIGLFLGNSAAGIYSAAEKLFTAMSLAFQPLVEALYPYMSRQRDIKLYKKIFIAVVFINLAFCSVVFMLSDNIIGIIYPGEFKVAADLLEIFSFICFITVPSVLLGYPFLAALGYPKYANYSVIYASLVHLALLVVIIPIMTVYHVAALLIITQLVVLGIRVFGVVKNKKEIFKITV